MDHIIVKEYQTKVGTLIIGSYKDELCLCDWKYRKMRDAIDVRIKSCLGTDYYEGDSLIIQNTIEQLQEYFSKKRTVFDLPLKFAGTEFQKRVWKELVLVPYGKQISYLELSRRLGNEKAVRAVASANGANAISIIVPCHRIIGMNGKMVGYAGGIDAKKKLLSLESSITQGELF